MKTETTPLSAAKALKKLIDFQSKYGVLTNGLDAAFFVIKKMFGHRFSDKVSDELCKLNNKQQ